MLRLRELLDHHRTLEMPGDLVKMNFWMGVEKGGGTESLRKKIHQNQLDRQRRLHSKLL